ncbi:MAG: hypothetical protein WEE64_02095 [Dehalococcoidia bacterium]
MTRHIALLTALALTAALAFAVACDDDGDGGVETPTTAEATVTAIAGEPTATGVPGGACSAAPLSETPVEQPDLPPAVAEMRQAIIEEAVACNFDQLQALALDGSATFSYSFGEPAEGGTPGAFWEGAEGQGEDALAMLVSVLNMPFAQRDGAYVWPFAYSLDFSKLSPAERTMLEQYFTPEEIDGWVQASAYLGYRAGITQAGDWTFFIAGD